MTTTRQRPTRGSWWVVEFYRSAVGKKWVMAITGVFLLGFVFAHMLGNLHAFEGPTELNEYGEALRTIGAPIVPHTVLLWLLRIGLIVAFALHIHAAYALTLVNRRARGDGYQDERHYLAANYASRTMRWSGVIVLLFLVWHLADLTWGVPVVNPEFVPGEVYANLTFSLGRWPVALLYIVAQVALALHIYHGAWSMFQSVGVNHPRFNLWRRRFATAMAVIVVGGYLTVPFGVLFGVLG